MRYNDDMGRCVVHKDNTSLLDNSNLRDSKGNKKASYYSGRPDTEKTGADRMKSLEVVTGYRGKTDKRPKILTRERGHNENLMQLQHRVKLNEGITRAREFGEPDRKMELGQFWGRRLYQRLYFKTGLYGIELGIFRNNMMKGGEGKSGDNRISKDVQVACMKADIEVPQAFKEDLISISNFNPDVFEIPQDLKKNTSQRQKYPSKSPLITKQINEEENIKTNRTKTNIKVLQISKSSSVKSIKSYVENENNKSIAPAFKVSLINRIVGLSNSNSKKEISPMKTAYNRPIHLNGNIRGKHRYSNSHNLERDFIKEMEPFTRTTCKKTPSENEINEQSEPIVIGEFLSGGRNRKLVRNSTSRLTRFEEEVYQDTGLNSKGFLTSKQQDEEDVDFFRRSKSKINSILERNTATSSHIPVSFKASKTQGGESWLNSRLKKIGHAPLGTEFEMSEIIGSLVALGKPLSDRRTNLNVLKRLLVKNK